MNELAKIPLEKMKIIRELTIVKKVGLARPAGGSDNPFLWNTKYLGRPPEWIRFVWNPQTGQAILGTYPFCNYHVEIIPPSRRYPFGAWVRGFYFPKLQWLPIRPFDWRDNPGEPWDDACRRLNDRIMKALVPLLKRLMPNATIELGIDNRRLTERTGMRGW